MLGYDYVRMLPVLEYSMVEVSNNAGRYLLEYILKQTEKVLREKLGISGSFKFSEYQLYEIYPYDLYYENYREGIIANTIEHVVKQISIETLANTLEDCHYTKGDKLVKALLMAKVLAEKIGGKAILELI